MRFDWSPNLDAGGCEIAAIPSDYDGSPAPSCLRLDYAPRFASPGRLAVAAVLAFRPYIAGALDFPAAISPELARNLMNLLAPVSVFPQPVDFHPKAIPLGTGTFVVEDGQEELGRSASSRSSVTRLRLTSGSRTFGHQLERDLVSVPTNAALLTPTSGDPLDAVLPLVAGAVLLAEDFGIGTIELPHATEKGRRRFALAEALGAAGLRLSFGDTAP